MLELRSCVYITDVQKCSGYRNKETEAKNGDRDEY